MNSQLTYFAARTRIDDLARAAAHRQASHVDAARPHAALSQMLRQPRHGLGQLRRVLNALDPRPATR